MTTHKSHVLGMPHGTAANKLRKLLLFDMAGRLGKLNCYRCNKPIETVEEFSIDHIQDWEYSNSPKDLFLDVKNIAFSHFICNINSSNRSRASLKKWTHGIANTYKKGCRCDLCRKAQYKTMHTKRKGETVSSSGP